MENALTKPRAKWQIWATIMATVMFASGALVALFYRPHQSQPTATASNQESEYRQFQNWYQQSPSRTEEVDAFFAFLKENGVDDIVPPYTLLMADGRVRAGCPFEKYIVPPKALWPEIVPTLKYVRATVIPNMGPVKVASAYRDPTANKCIGGASQSRHLTFSAIDLVPVDSAVDGTDYFNRLCAIWHHTPSNVPVGFGAYYDGVRAHHPLLRFHIDTKGRRTWGPDYHAGSSFCRQNPQNQ